MATIDGMFKKGIFGIENGEGEFGKDGYEIFGKDLGATLGKMEKDGNFMGIDFFGCTKGSKRTPNDIKIRPFTANYRRGRTV
jgi:hypothetical protein